MLAWEMIDMVLNNGKTPREPGGKLNNTLKYDPVLVSWWQVGCGGWQVVCGVCAGGYGFAFGRHSCSGHNGQ